nr:MAG TPA: hypothetical protein [Caudoviricetes sp.]
MCNRCDYDSPDNRIYVDPLTNEYYLDILKHLNGMSMMMDLSIRKSILHIVLGVAGN